MCSRSIQADLKITFFNKALDDTFRDAAKIEKRVPFCGSADADDAFAGRPGVGKKRYECVAVRVNALCEPDESFLAVQSIFFLQCERFSHRSGHTMRSLEACVNPDGTVMTRYPLYVKDFHAEPFKQQSKRMERVVSQMLVIDGIVPEC